MYTKRYIRVIAQVPLYKWETTGGYHWEYAKQGEE